MVYKKKAYGLSIDTEFNIEEFLTRPGNLPGDVLIQAGEFSIPRKPGPFCRRKVMTSPAGIIMYWKGVGSFLMEEGRRITVMADKRYDRPGIINALLIGPCMGVILFQRNKHNIYHGAVVGKPDGKGALCLMGRKGDGKSTMATALCNHGYSLISDDLLVLEKNSLPPMVQSGFPGMKLWATAAKALVDKGEELPMIGKKGEMEKRIRDMGDNFLEESQPLKAVILLEFDDDREKSVIEPLGEVEAMQEILAHWYGALFKGELLPILGKERHFEECSALVKNIPVYRLIRPYDLEKMHESVTILDDLRERIYS